MSSDLLQAFTQIPENTTKAQKEDDVIAQVDDDFGDFENPENTVISDAIPEPSQNAASLISIPEMSTSSKKEYLESKHQPQLPSTVAEIQALDDADDWGDFAGGSVLFDADQAKRREDSSTSSKPISSSRPEETTPIEVSLLPIDQRRANDRAPRPVQKPAAEPYDYTPDEIWEPTDIKQNPIIPAKPPASTDLISANESSNKQTLRLGRKISGPPPGNIPPPSVLLRLVILYFQSLPGVIKTIIHVPEVYSNLSKALSQLQIDQVEEVLAKARSGGRVLAGRKLRWKRDNLLSQSMKIGPASGKSSGMKLTGVDKGESRREDQEAAEVLDIWRKQLGPIRSLISVLNSQHPGNGLTLPDISENMPVRVVKPSEGAVTAPKCCFLCGIKRDERVAKIDVDVEDSFGEWWCEHWGHVDCVHFWEKYKDSLPQR